MGTLPQLERAKSLRRNGYLDLIEESHMRKSSGQLLKGALETPEVLQGDIKRLSKGIRDVPQTHSGSCSRSHTRSHTRPQFGRRVTFREPEVEPDLNGCVENCPPEPPILDVETWLDCQDCQLSTTTWWVELKAIPGMKDLQKLTHKIWASFSIPEVRMRAIPGKMYTVPPPQMPQQECLPPGWLIIPGCMAATYSPDDRLCQRATILGWKA